MPPALTTMPTALVAAQLATKRAVSKPRSSDSRMLGWNRRMGWSHHCEGSGAATAGVGDEAAAPARKILFSMKSLRVMILLLKGGLTSSDPHDCRAGRGQLDSELSTAHWQNFRLRRIPCTCRCNFFSNQCNARLGIDSVAA